MIVDKHRRKFKLDPYLTDRQLWALGMIVVQWSILEKVVDQHATALFDDATLHVYRSTTSFSGRREIWKNAIKKTMREPYRSDYLEAVTKIADLQQQRDMYVHGIYGGMKEPHQEYRHAGQVRNLSHVKGAGAPKPTQFATMNKVAFDLSELCRSILLTEQMLLEQTGAANLRDALRHICE